MVNSPMLARRLHHSPRRKPFPCIALRTLDLSLRSFCAPRPFFSTTSTLFLQNTRVAYPPALTFASAPSVLAIPLRELISSRLAPLLDRSSMLFRINTYKSVSKQTTLTSFRINTCEKQGEGEGSVADELARHSPLATRHFPTALCFHTLTNCFSRKPFLFTIIRIAPGWRGTIHCGTAISGCEGKERRGLSTLDSRHFPPQNKRAMYSRIWCFQYGQSWPPCGPQLSREWRMPLEASTSESRYEGPEFSHGPVPVAM